MRKNACRCVVLIIVLFSVNALAQPPRPAKNTLSYLETGDLEAIKKRGVFRILMPIPSEYEDILPRQGFPLHYESIVLEKFAKSLKLTPEFIYVDKRDELIPKLLAGEADIIAANLTVTDKRKKLINFSIPYETAIEQIVSRRGDTLSSLKDLKGRTVGVHESSSFWETIQTLKQKIPQLKIKKMDEKIPTEELLELVSDGKLDLTVADSNLINAFIAQDDSLKAAINLTESRPIAWGVRPNAVELKKTLDLFIESEHWLKSKNQLFKDDWREIKQRKILRVLTRNNAATYFLWRGEILGFEYELLKQFAQAHDLHLEMIVPSGRDQLVTWLKEGRGDMVAASLTINDQHRPDGVQFTRFYHQVDEVLVSRSKDKALLELKELTGRTVTARQSSSYWATLQSLRAQGINVNIAAAPEDMETEEIIQKVAEGQFDLAIADSHIVDIELTTRDDIQRDLVVKQDVRHGWMVRDNSMDLKKKLDQYIKEQYRGKFYNLLKDKYFKNKHAINKHKKSRVDTGRGEISPYELLTRKYAQQFGFDWRLVTAQMYQESGFDPLAKSWMGALGLMQVMPKTGAEFGFKNLSDPEEGIHAGVRYLAWLRDRFKDELSVNDRMWFMLASYNAGLGHVIDARRLAVKKNWDENVWFNHVEKAMLLLSKPEFSKKARYGYVRGQEPVTYVANIRDRFIAYQRLVQQSIIMVPETAELQTQLYPQLYLGSNVYPQTQQW